MEYIIVLIFASIGSMLFISFVSRKKEKNASIPKRSMTLYGSSNRNSYTNAREVFKTIENAGIEINFLGGKHE